MINFYKSILGKLRPVAFTLTMLLVSQAVWAAPMSGAYTINKSVAASSTNFTTFQAFFTALASNGVNGPVVVDVLNGPYTQQVSATAISGVSSTNTITVNGNGQVLNFSATSSSAQHTFMFNGADYVTLKNLTIEALGTTYAWGVRLTNNSDYITIDGCTVRVPNVTSTSSLNSVCITATASTTSPASSGSNCKYLTVQNSVLTGGTSNGPYYGLCLYAQASNTTVSGIKITNNTIKNFYIYGNYFYNCNDLLFEKNHVMRDNNYTRISTTYGMYVILCQNIRVKNNEIHDLFNAVTSTSTFYAMLFTSNTTSSTQHEISNNLIYNNNSRGSWFGIYLSCTYNVDIVHNTVSHQNITPTSGTQYGVYLSCSYTGRRVRNNIIALDMPGTTTRYGIYNGGITTTMDIDRNTIYVTGTNANVGYYNGNQITPADWQAVTAPGAPFDANSYFGNPNFASTTVGSQLIPQSVNLDDLGQPTTGITTDIAGSPRSLNTPDPGAYEFTIDANVNDLTTTGGSQACLGEKDEVKVWIKNSSPIAISGFNVNYLVNGGSKVSEPFPGSIPAGDSAQFTFATLVDLNAVGNTDIDAFIASKPKYGPFSINVKPSPVGSEIVKGSAFNGLFLTGNSQDPDVVANPDDVTYDFTAPTGYDNKDYGVTWVINTFNASTAKSATLLPSDIVRTNASNGVNYKIKIKPAAGLTDDTISFNIAAYSLTTLCEAPAVDRVIFVAPRPKADFTVSDVCDKEAASFISTSTISSGTMKYSWEFGDGSVSDFADNNKTYTTHGSYSVKLTATSNYGYTNSITKTVNVYQAPSADFGYDNQCEGVSIPFTNNSSVANGTPVYEWNFGDNSGSSSVTNPSYMYAAPGFYTVSLKVTDAKNCATTITKPISYFKKSVANFNVPATVCNAADVVFVNTSIPAGNTGYSWDFGNGNPSQTKDGKASYAAAGTYTVKLFARNDFGCVDSIAKTFTTAEAPVADFNVNGKCIGEMVTFDNTTNEPVGFTTGYEWNFGETGANSTAKTGNYTFTSVGDYTITLKAIATNGCVTEKKSVVSFGEKPVASFSLAANACSGQDVQIVNGSKVSSGALSYSWDLGNGTSTSTSPVANYAAAGNYTVSLVATSGVGCTASATGSITITETPNSDFTIESSKTGNGGVTLTPFAPGTSAKYTWLYGDGSSSSSSAKHNYTYNSKIGYFVITLMVEQNGCSSRTTKDLIINALGVDELAENNLNVYPNPTTGAVKISATNLAGMQEVNVTDALGKVVYSTKVNFSAAPVVDLDLTGLKQGLYFVSVSNQENTYVQKINLLNY